MTISFIGKTSALVLFGFTATLYLSLTDTLFGTPLTQACSGNTRVPSVQKPDSLDPDFNSAHSNLSVKGCQTMLEFGYEAFRKLWRPYGCDMATYNYEQLSGPMEALKKSTNRSHVGVLLVGDSRMRQLQIALYKHFKNQSDLTREMPPDVFCDRDDAIKYTSYFNETLQSCEFERVVEPHQLALSRWWIPFLEHNTVERRLKTLLSSKVENMPHLVVFNAGLWLIRDCYENYTPFGECMTYFERNVTNLLPVLEEVAKYSTVVWTLQYPVVWRPKTAQMSRKLAILNHLLLKILQKSSVKVWKSFHQAFDVFADSADRVHFGTKGLELVLQIALNFLFNDVAPAKQGVCCSRSVY